jgi:integrase
VISALVIDSGRITAYAEVILQAMVFVLAAATGLRCGELSALRLNGVDFKTGTICADESADQRTCKIGPCKNAAAYRIVLLADSQGKEALSMPKRFLKGNQNPSALVFRSKRASPIPETSVLHEFLHLVL